MLNVLLSSGISFALAIVVRYFGGKKLGVPGLIEAYGSSVKECLAKAEIRNLELRSYMRCSIDAGLEYLLFNLQEMNPDIELSKGPSYFEISCSQSMTHELRTKLQNMSTLKFIDE
jgi:putative IMPACT (imprinted ancient) family translation regulator